VEVGGEVEVMTGIEGTEVGLLTQTSELPGETVIGGAALPIFLESESTTTTVVPEEIDTASQVNESPVTSVKAARTGPEALPSWKARVNGPTPVVVSYVMVRGSQVVMIPGGTTWNALATEARMERADNTANFMTGV